MVLHRCNKANIIIALSYTHTCLWQSMLPVQRKQIALEIFLFCKCDFCCTHILKLYINTCRMSKHTTRKLFVIRLSENIIKYICISEQIWTRYNDRTTFIKKDWSQKYYRRKNLRTWIFCISILISLKGNLFQISINIFITNFDARSKNQ